MVFTTSCVDSVWHIAASNNTTINAQLCTMPSANRSCSNLCKPSLAELFGMCCMPTRMQALLISDVCVAEADESCLHLSQARLQRCTVRCQDQAQVIHAPFFICFPAAHNICIFGMYQVASTKTSLRRTGEATSRG